MVRLLVLSLVLAGCTPSGLVAGRSADPEVPLRLAAEARVSGGALVGTFRLTNQTADALPIGFGQCSATLLGWRDAARTGPPAFDVRWARPPDDPHGSLCQLYLAMPTLEPGETLTQRDARELAVRAPVADVLSDSLPDGRYWLAAVLDVTDEGERADRWTSPLRVDLGALDLAAPRAPLTAERQRLGARFRVDSVRTEAGHLRAVVHVAPIPNVMDGFAGFAPCALRVLAYADPARRDVAPRAGPPGASVETACGQTVEPFRRPGGEAPSGEASVEEVSVEEPPFYLRREAPARLDLDVPLDRLLGDLPAGRYALAVAVRTLASGYELRPLPPVYLRLGDADRPGR